MKVMNKRVMNALIGRIGWVVPIGNEGREEQNHFCAIGYTYDFINICDFL